MDEFSLDRPELSGSLITMEFGAGGRVQQLWVADPALQGGGDEFQFVASPISFGEEFVEDYYPGTILIGARTNPDDPWILSRNANAEILEDGPGMVAFEYDFGLLPELRATGRFHELPGPLPQIAWDLTIVNRGRISVEIGELGFPMALNNMMDAFAGEGGREDLLRDRVTIQKFIGGAGSYLFAQRVNAEPPGLLIYPGEDTYWEFYNHVAASLNTPFDWDGIPVVYVYSRAAIEREGWNEWFNGHTASVLEPGDERKFQIRFVPASRNSSDLVNQTLAVCERPAIRVFPGAVAPVDVGIAMEVSGARPTRFFANDEADLEMESDEEGGFCFVRPESPGPLQLSFEDTKGRISYAHLLFTEPIEALIKKRASWICEHQVYRQKGSNLHNAILPASISDGQPISNPELYTSSFGVESILSEAMFLAEKNTIYPLTGEVEILERFVSDFLLQSLQNPADGGIGCTFLDSRSVAFDQSCGRLYPMVAAIYDAMARISASYGTKINDEARYDELFELTKAGATRYLPLNDSDDPVMTPRSTNNIFAIRSMAPSWWWYGSEARSWEDSDGYRHPLLADRGEVCFSPYTTVHALPLFQNLQFDLSKLPDTWLRSALGGMLGIWALVRSDGAAAAGFCPDSASRNYGMVPITGDIGIGLYAYLKAMGAYVLPSRSSGTTAIACHIDSEHRPDADVFIVRPWDGVGKRVSVRQAGLEVEAHIGKINEVRFNSRKRWAEVEIENPADRAREVRFTVKGLWGSRFNVQGQTFEGSEGSVMLAAPLAAHSSDRVEIEVIG